MKRKRIFSGVVGVVGFLLSPVSWWNDLIVNFPLSYIIAMPFGLLNKRLFLPAFIVGYWSTNILGLLLMHFGLGGAIKGSFGVTKDELVKTMLFCAIYSVVITVLIQTGVLSLPQDMLTRAVQFFK